MSIVEQTIKIVPKLRSNIREIFSCCVAALEYETKLKVVKMCLTGSRASMYYDPKASDIDINIVFGRTSNNVTNFPAEPNGNKTIFAKWHNAEEYFCVKMGECIRNKTSIDCEVSVIEELGVWRIQQSGQADELLDFICPTYDVFKKEWIKSPFLLAIDGKILKSIRKYNEGKEEESERCLQECMDKVLWEY